MMIPLAKNDEWDNAKKFLCLSLEPKGLWLQLYLSARKNYGIWIWSKAEQELTQWPFKLEQIAILEKFYFWKRIKV